MPKRVPIVVPKAGMSMVEATVVAWRKSPGDHVQAGEAIVELETDKVELQVQAPATASCGRSSSPPTRTRRWEPRWA